MMAPRTSIDASRMIEASDWVLPSLRRWRSRRQMFSMSMIASSTTSPMAMIMPARIITLMVVPRRSRISPAVSKRQRYGDDADQRRPPFEQEEEQDHHYENAAEDQRIGEVADRYLDEGGRAEYLRVDVDPLQARQPSPSRPRRHSRVTSSVLAQGNFSTISRMPGPSLMIASPISGWWSSTSRATSVSLRSGPSLNGDLAEVLGRDDRQHMADRQALIRSVDEPAAADERTFGEGYETGVESVADRLVHGLERHVVGGELVRLDLHLVHFQPFAVNHHVRYAGNAQQPGPDLPVADHGKIDQR